MILAIIYSEPIKISLFEGYSSGETNQTENRMSVGVDNVSLSFSHQVFTVPAVLLQRRGKLQTPGFPFIITMGCSSSLPSTISELSFCNRDDGYQWWYNPLLVVTVYFPSQQSIVLAELDPTQSNPTRCVYCGLVPLHLVPLRFSDSRN